MTAEKSTNKHGRTLGTSCSLFTPQIFMFIQGLKYSSFHSTLDL